jgi:hypothetical protein
LLVILDDGAVYAGTMPVVVITCGIQKFLVHGTANNLLVHIFILGEHVVLQGVRLSLHPELGLSLHVALLAI